MIHNDNWLVHDHQRYEAALDECELFAGAGDWSDAIRMFHGFADDLKLHMRMEDEVVFPFFVEETGDPDDEIIELRDEHSTLTRLLNDLAYIIKTMDFDHFEDSLIPLKNTLLKHDRHEEAIFQKMKDKSLFTRRSEILERMNAMETTTNQ
jgi:hemerythrin superfamily protein